MNMNFSRIPLVSAAVALVAYIHAAAYSLTKTVAEALAPPTGGLAFAGAGTGPTAAQGWSKPAKKQQGANELTAAARMARQAGVNSHDRVNNGVQREAGHMVQSGIVHQPVARYDDATSFGAQSGSHHMVV